MSYGLHNSHTSLAADSTILISAFSNSLVLSPGLPSEASTGSSSVMRINAISQESEFVWIQLL